MRDVWLTLLALAACSNTPDESTFSYEPEQESVRPAEDAARPEAPENPAATEDPDVTVRHVGGWTIRSKMCRQVRDVKGPPSNQKDATKENYCGLLANSVALCESAEQEEGDCEERVWRANRAFVIYQECMNNPVDESKLPHYVDSLSTCAYGEDYDNGFYLNFPCRHRYACWRSIGIDWTPFEGQVAEAET